MTDLVLKQEFNMSFITTQHIGTILLINFGIINSNIDDVGIMVTFANTTSLRRARQFNLPGGGNLNCYYCNVYIDGKYQANSGIGYPPSGWTPSGGWYPQSGGNQPNGWYPPSDWTPSGGWNPGIAYDPNNEPYYPSDGPDQPEYAPQNGGFCKKMCPRAFVCGRWKYKYSDCKQTPKCPVCATRCNLSSNAPGGVCRERYTAPPRDPTDSIWNG